MAIVGVKINDHSRSGHGVTSERKEKKWPQSEWRCKSHSMSGDKMLTLEMMMGWPCRIEDEIATV